LSVSNAPESEASMRFGADGTGGASRSTVTGNTVAFPETAATGSVTVAAMSHTPLVSGPRSHEETMGDAV